ncbi:MAG: 5'-nucleotidase C-terminal domain-containing protein [Velocimicrobium sp.]
MNVFKKMKRSMAITCAIAMTVTSIQVTPIVSKAAEGDNTKFVVLSTTDMHGKCWGTNVLNDTATSNTMLNVSTAVQSIRDQYNTSNQDNVILIDNGDTFQGTPVSSYSITSAGTDFTGETPMAIAMKYLDYDAFVLGNHEFNYPWDTMQKVYSYIKDSTIDVDADNEADAGVPVLAANLVYKETKDGHTANENAFGTWISKDITVGDKTLTVGILGLENTDCTRWDVVDNYPNVNFAHLENTSYDMVYEAQKYVNEMKTAGCDFVVVSYHSGLGSDSTDLTFGTNTENQALRVIKNTTGIDMMITGHDHSDSYTNQKYENKNGENVVVVNGGGTDLTKTEITATEQSDGSISYSVADETGNVDVTAYGQDETLKGLINNYAEQASAYVNQTCGTIADASWDTNSNYYLEQTDTMDLINRAQITEGEAYLKQKYASGEALSVLQAKYGDTYSLDVDMSASSVVVSKNYTVKAGPLTMKTIYEFYKYDNSLYILPVTGAQIKEFLEYVAENRIGYTIKNGAITYKTINDYFTCPVFYGLDFTYDMSKEAGNRVTILGFKSGKPFELDRTYNFAINNYHLSNGPFAKYTPADTIWSQTNDLGGGVVQDLIKDYVASASPAGISPDPSNWSVTYSAEIPVEEVKEKEPLEIYDPIPTTTFADTYATAVNIQAAAAKTSGKGVVIGQIVKTYNTKYHIMEDLIDGQIYGYLIYDSKNTYTDGDVVAVSGDFTSYGGIPEMGNVTDVKVIQSLGTDFMIAPQVVTVDKLGDDYINETIVVQDVAASNSTITDATGSVSFYSGASLPTDVTSGTTKIDAYAVCSSYSGTLQLRNASSADYVIHNGTPDPIADTLFSTGIGTISDAVAATKGDAVTALGQVVYKYCSLAGADGDKSSIILQDVISGKVVGIQVYDTKNFADYYIGDVVKVSGTRSDNGGVPQITASSVERVKTTVSFQPQMVTVNQLGENYLSEYIMIKTATVGTNVANGSTPVTDTTGSVNIYRSAEFPTGVLAGDTVDVEGVCSAYKGTYQLRVGSSFDFIKEAGVEEPIVDKDSYRIPVVETTDVHGFLLDVSSGDPSTYQYRLARVADAVDDLRADDTKGDVLLLDGGDIYQGNPVSNLLEGESMIAAYDYMKYDAVALGNHEFDWSVTDLIDSDATMGSYSLSNSIGTVSGDSQIPVLCSNIYKAGTDEKVDFTKDYIIVNKEGQSLNGEKKTFKVAIFGYAEDYSSDIMAAKIAPYEIKESDLSKLEIEAKQLEASKEADVCILLSHAGAASMSKSLSSDTAFDMVLGGHTHVDAAKNSADTTSVPYLQTKNQVYSYGYAELCVSTGGAVSVENAENKTVYSSGTKATLYNTTANAENLDPEIIKISNIAVQEVAPTMNVELGTITEQVTKTAINGNAYSSTAGNFMTELMNAATGAKVSFTNNGGIRTEFTYDDSKRMLTAGDIYTIAPFCNLLPTFELTYKELIDLIQYAIGDGSSLGLRMGGATAYYDGTTVKTLFIGDKLIYKDGTYQTGYSESGTILVSTNEYIATASGTPFKSKTSIEASKGETALTDNEAFIAALKMEGAANSGSIYVNPNATLIEDTWDGTSVPEDKSDRFTKKSDDTYNGPVINPTTDDKTDDSKENPSTGVGQVVVIDKADNVTTSISTNSIKATEKKGVFYNKEGKKITDAIVTTEAGERFIINEDGEKYVSAIVETKNGTKYITSEEGAVITGSVVEVNGVKFYTTKNTGKVITNKIFKMDGEKYIATKTGAIARGTIVTKDGNKYYTTKNTGKVVADKVFTLKGKKYIARKTGKLVVSKWITIDGTKYYCNKNGAVIKTK